MLKKSLSLLVALLSISLLLSCQSEQQKAPLLEFINSGDILPIQTITTIDGELINLQRTDKKKLVILFATWCPDSSRFLKALNNDPLLADKNIEIIAIAREEQEKEVKAWRDEHNINVPIAVDPDRSIYKKFASGGIPRLITVSADNKIIKMNLAEDEEQLSKIEW